MKKICILRLCLSLFLSSFFSFHAHAGSFQFYAWPGAIKMAQKKGTAAIATNETSSTSTTTTAAATSTTASTSSDSDIVTKIKTDYSNYMKSTSVGESRKVAGGHSIAQVLERFSLMNLEKKFCFQKVIRISIPLL